METGRRKPLDSLSANPGRAEALAMKSRVNSESCPEMNFGKACFCGEAKGIPQSHLFINYGDYRPYPTKKAGCSSRGGKG